MWEYSIVFSRNKLELAKKINKEIQSFVKNKNGISTLLITKFNISILVAVPDSQGEVSDLFIKDKIIGLYVNEYKLNYLLENFNFEVTDNISMKAFIKALLMFDIETDRRIVKQKLVGFNSIVIDSFFNFRLQVLKNRWNDLVNLANDNIMYLMSRDTIIELLKFLISNLEFNCEMVKIKQNGENFILYDEKGDLIKDEKCRDILDNDSLITTLIYLNPKKIRLDETYNMRNGAINLVCELFNNRVETFK